MNGFKKMQGFSEDSIGNLVTLFVGLINIILNRIKEEIEEWAKLKTLRYLQQTHKARWPNFYSLTADHNNTYYRLTDGQKLIIDCISMSHTLFLLFYQNMFYKNIEAEYF